MDITALLIGAVALLVGAAAGYYLRLIVSMGKRGSMELEIKQKMIAAKEEAQEIIDNAKTRAEELTQAAHKEHEEKQHELKKTEERLVKKEEHLDAKQEDLTKRDTHLQEKEKEVAAMHEEAAQIEHDRVKTLEQAARLTQEEAHKELVAAIEKNQEEDLMVRMQKLEQTTEEKLDRRAKEILSTTIQRLATSTASDIMTTTVTIPSDDIKGKVIGKEGRNIRAFEREAGVELIVDDTPGTIVISSFDPIRRQVARVALENLILDGRIQPARIEEELEKSREEINKIIKQKGEEAVYECGIFNLDPRITAILGRLYFRTSYGQNVLQHSIEMAHIAGMLAEEVGADVQIAKAGALVHDIGKALDHEVQGSHVDIGMRILQKFGADGRIITAMKSHHEDYPYESIEAVIVQTADAISGGRPGARRDTVENYLKRLQDLEALSASFPGVDKAYAVAAGREVRIFVTPEQISDVEAKETARDIAKKIESDLKYPGEIKVVVIRENRIIEHAR